jgi:hypothetical protein
MPPSPGGACDQCQRSSIHVPPKIGSYFSRDHERFFFHAPSAQLRIDHTPFHFVHDFLRKILKPQRARVISKLMSKRRLH